MKFFIFLTVILNLQLTVFSYKEDYCISLSPETLQKLITKKYELPDGRRVLIFDDIIPDDRLIILRSFMNVNDHWRFVLFDEHFSDKNVKYDSGNGIPFKSWQDAALFSTTKIGFTLKNIVQATDKIVTGKNETDFELNEIYASVTRRADRTLPYAEMQKGQKGYSIAIYNNIVWRKNDYGEMLFYDDDDEIFGIVRPKYGRVIIWDSSITYISRPPSMKQLLGQNIIFAHFSADVEITREKREHVRKMLNDIKEAPNRDFVATDNIESVMNKDVAPHLTMLRENYKGYKVAVFDDLFPKEDLDALRTWTIKFGRYFYEDDLDTTSDNVHWIAAIPIHKLVKSRFWPVIHNIATYISGNDSWYPYDVACNLIRTTDHTRFHLDTSHAGEKEMTFLLYLSPNWTAADYGETAFMQKNNNADDNEYVAEVVPDYGRAVIFDGNFPHSARPPSVMHYGPRYTLAVKLSENRWEAAKKTFSEESRHEPGLVSALNTADELARGKDMTVALHKVNGVAQYHKMLQIQHVLGKFPGDKSSDMEGGEEEGPEGEEGEEGEDGMEQDGEEEMEGEESDEEERGDGGRNRLTRDEEELYEMAAGEMEVDLPYKSKKLIVDMMQHHISLSQSEAKDEEEESGKMTVPENKKYSKIFNPNRRQKLIQAWIKKADGNAEELDGYLELMLQQQNWLKNEVEYRMLGIL